MKKAENLSIFDAIEQTDSPTPAQIIGEQVFSVTAAVDLINGILEPLTITIEGEVSSFKVSQNKWVFFDIKDQSSVLNCFMVLWALPFALEDGMHIKLQASPKIRGQNGRFSLTVHSLELLGEGALQKAFEELRRKLESEELFLDKWKKPLPFFPKTIGLVTSKTGDALQDMLRIMRNRAGGLKILLAPVAVQGQSAVDEICRAISFFNTHHPVDVLIVARGGGSLEDLQAFNSEPVVRAIFASKIPVVTGVGHEPDITLVDLVADVRAATPTNAAEIATPDFAELLADLAHTEARITTGLRHFMVLQRHLLDTVINRLRHALEEPVRQVDTLKERLFYQLKQRERTFWKHQTDIQRGAQVLQASKNLIISLTQQQIMVLESKLGSLNPEAVLTRGYSIVTSVDGVIVKSTKQVALQDQLAVQLSDGTIRSTVTGKEE